MSLKFPISLTGKREDVAAVTATELYDSGDNLVVSLGGDIPDNWQDNYTFTEPVYRRVVIGTSCTSIGTAAFRYQYDIIQNTTLIPDSVITIKDKSFESASNLGDLIIGKNVTSIGEYAFAFSTVNRIEIHAVTAPTIGLYAFNFVFPADSSIHVPSNATGYAASYDGLTVVYDLPAV
ncbi:MAG: leucine-rich repeat protein [Akkermansiaceae bacterium]